MGRHKAGEMFLFFKPEETGLCCNGRFNLIS